MFGASFRKCNSVADNGGTLSGKKKARTVFAKLSQCGVQKSAERRHPQENEVSSGFELGRVLIIRDARSKHARMSASNQKQRESGHTWRAEKGPKPDVLSPAHLP